MDAPLWGTRAGTQAPPLPISVIHPRTILPNDINHPNETRKQSIHTSGAEMHRALPPPLLKIKKCVYRYDLGVTVDDAICFKTSYSFGVTVNNAFCFKTSYSFGVTVASP